MNLQKLIANETSSEISPTTACPAVSPGSTAGSATAKARAFLDLMPASASHTLAHQELQSEKPGASALREDSLGGPAQVHCFGRSGLGHKSALLAVIEVHSSLCKLEMECSQQIEDAISLSNWTITTRAPADRNEDVCSEFVSTPTRSSSVMTGASSVLPDTPELDVSFDSYELGFWSDVGVRTFHSWKGRTEVVPEHALSEECIMPWET